MKPYSHRRKLNNAEKALKEIEEDIPIEDIKEKLVKLIKIHVPTSLYAQIYQ